MTIQEFMEKHAITMAYERAYPVPRDEWEERAFHFRCSFDHRGKPYATPFVMGEGNAETGPDGETVTPTPPAHWVLSSLRDDASGAETPGGFEEWCDDMKQDPDSRRAYAMWQDMGRIARELREWLGDDPYAELLTCDPE